MPVHLLVGCALLCALPAPDVRAPSAPADVAVANDNRHPAGSLRGGVLTLRLEVREGIWRPESDSGGALRVQAFAEAGGPLRVPGPLIRVPAGTEVLVSVHNTLRDSTLVVHGLTDRPAAGGDSAVRVAPGETRAVRFALRAPGTYYYWGSTTGLPLEHREWLDSQLGGAIVVDPPGAAPADDRTFVLGMWIQEADSSGPAPRPRREILTINGKSWPFTERLTYAVGDSVRWRWINATRSAHPMHLHGFYFRVDSRGDGTGDATLPPDRRALEVTELMGMGSTMTMPWKATTEGTWVFHCHFAFHVSHLATMAGPPSPRPMGPMGPSHALATHDGTRGPATAGAMAHSMAGLVLGLHVVRPGGASYAVADGEPAQAARAIRILVQSREKRFGAKPGYGFVVQDGASSEVKEVKRDSIAIPGSLLLLRRGEPVRITVVNRLSAPTAVHWHGLEIPSFPDGVPGWSGTPRRTFAPIAPGDSFVAAFTPPRAGTFIYHTHADELEQMRGGLYAPLVVTDSAHPFDPAVDKIVIVGGGGPVRAEGDREPVFVNGSPEPAPLELRVGSTYRLRLINIEPDWRVQFALTSDTALLRWRPIAKDGADLPPALAVERPAFILTGPGETADFEFTPVAPGAVRLEVKSRIPGWYIPLPIVVRR